MRNISFMLTPDQIRAGTKTVTRRMGWANLKPGTLLSPVKKGMGLKPGEKIERLREPIRVTSVQREPLRMLLDSPIYGQRECMREGFPEYTPASFIDMFCRSHKGCMPDSVVTRIEFEYVSSECLLGSRNGEKYPSCSKYPDCICGGPQDQPSGNA